MDTIGNIPEFTTEEVKEPAVDPVKDTTTEETDTPAPPAEKPLAKQGNDVLPEEYSDEHQRAIQGLQAERVKLLKEISELKGQKREIKKEQLDTVQKDIDELKDLHPDDVSTIERVLRAKGLITKEEAQAMYQTAIREDELNRFLEKYPEYKPENDPDDINWNMLQRELRYYKIPSDPHEVRNVLERAHRGIIRAPSNTGVETRKRQVEIASVGKGGQQRTASTLERLTPEKRAMLKGFSEEEIQKMEERLTG